LLKTVIAAVVVSSRSAVMNSNWLFVIALSWGRIRSRTFLYSLWMRRTLTSKPSRTGSRLSRGWIFSMTLAYLSRDVRESSRSLLRVARSRTSDSRARTISFAPERSSSVVLPRSSLARFSISASTGFPGRVLAIPRNFESTAEISSDFPIAMGENTGSLMGMGISWRWTVPSW